MSALHAAILAPFLFAAGLPLLARLLRRIHPGWVVFPVPLALFLYFLRNIPAVKDGQPVSESVSWIPSLGIHLSLYMDGLSLLFVLLISGIGSLVTFYSIFYMDRRKEDINRFYVYLLLFMGAMLGVVLSDNLMVLYGFWELTSISSFLLIAFWHRRDRSKYAAQKSLLITVIGGLAMFAGFLLLYLMTGTFSVREMLAQIGTIQGSPLLIPAMLLILLGAFTKSAQFPFHIWLPDAMEAPTPVSAYLHSATMVKAGLYVVARFSPFFAGEQIWFWIVSLTGLITLLYASFQATRQTDLKAILAYSTVSQLGLIMSLLGLGSASVIHGDVAYTKATAAAVFHLINHAIFKGSLFMAVGIVDHETGTRDIRKLGGLIAVMPITFSIALAGSFSMAGLPPFSGFLSKEMFFSAVLGLSNLEMSGGQIVLAFIPAAAWAASVFTFLYSMLLLFKTFAGPRKPGLPMANPHEPALGMLVPPVALVSLAVVFGLFPNLLSETLIEPVMASILPGLLEPNQSFLVSIGMWHGWTAEVWMTLGVILAGTALYVLYGKLNVMEKAVPERFSFSFIYDRCLHAFEKISASLTQSYMTGSIRHYLIYIFVFVAFTVGGTLFAGKGIGWFSGSYAPVTLYETVIAAVMALAALAVPFARSRLMSIIFTGAVGYMVTLLFVLFRAPDLALTQLVVETVSVALFLLCFLHLPKLEKKFVSKRRKMANLAVSAAVGALVTLVALAALAGPSFDTISHYFVKESDELAGGKNVVNVILVDFRGFDTLLEITVLGIASLGIYSLIRLRMEPGGTSRALAAEAGRKADERRAVLPRSNDVMLRTVTRSAVYIILTFSLYLFFAGHNAPGGGFIGALVAAAALVLLAIAFDIRLAEQTVPINFRKLTAAGLAVALLTGIGSFVFGQPFLSHAFGHFDLPILGETELATAVLFDLGVYMTVTGVAMTILLTIGKDDGSWKS